MARKRSFEAGFFQGMHLSAKMSEVSYFAALMKYKDDGLYKDLGYERWDEFCLEEIGVSDETLRRRFEALRELGPEMTKLLVGMNLKWKDVKALTGVIDEGQKGNLKKGIIEIEGKKIPVNEEHAEDIKSAIDILIERTALANKAEKFANQKLQGIDKEHGKEVKAYQKEITDLKAMVIEPGTPEEFDEVFRAVERKVDEIVILISRMDFSEAHKDVDADGPVKAKYKVRMDTMETQFNNLVSDIRDAVFGR